jgi:hypothetical protein
MINTPCRFVDIASTAQMLKRFFTEAKQRMTPMMCEAIDIICSKLARIGCGEQNESEHWRDISAFATLVAESLETQNKTNISDWSLEAQRKNAKKQQIKNIEDR